MASERTPARFRMSVTETLLCAVIYAAPTALLMAALWGRGEGRG